MLREGKERPKQKPKKENKENHGRMHQKVQEKTTIENISLYDAWIELTNDACSNALRTIQLYFKNKELTWTWDLEQNPQNFEKPTFKNLTKLSN